MAQGTESPGISHDTRHIRDDGRSSASDGMLAAGLGEPDRPLGSPGRITRVAPFALVMTLAFPLIMFSAVGSPAALAAATASFVVIVAAALLLPWRRWPAWSEVIPVYASFGVIALLREAGGGFVSAYGALAVLPVVWLALYHTRAQLLGGLVIQTAIFLLPPALLGPPEYPLSEFRRTALLVAVSTVVAVTTQQLVIRVRRDARALAAAEARTRLDRDFTNAVLETADCLVMVLDQDCRVRLFNRACERITGRRAAEVAGGAPWPMFARAEDAEAAQHAFGKVFAGRHPQHAEHDWLAIDGSRRRIAWTATALPDDAGKIRHAVVTGLDLTERRRLERLFADVLAAATEQAIIGTDPNGAVTVFNVGAERLLGYRADEVRGRLALDAFHDPAELAQRAVTLGVAPGWEVLVRPARSGHAETREWTYCRKDGTTAPVSLTVSAMQDESGLLTGFLAIARDITAERAATRALVEAYQRERAAGARLRDLDQARSDFVSSVSHDLRTPLTSVLGYMEMLLDGDAGDLTSGQRRLLEVAHRNARRLLGLVQDILLISRIDAGMFMLDRRPVSLEKVIDNALEAVTQPAGRLVQLEVATLPAPLLLDADAEQLERALTNLIGNAVKFTPDGGRVTVAASAEVGFATVSVSDTGIGIPAEDLPRVFDRFFRSSRAQQQGLPGSGLGLAITKAIVDAHGGTIEATSELGRGTTMVFTVPLAREPESASGQTSRGK